MRVTLLAIIAATVGGLGAKLVRNADVQAFTSGRVARTQRSAAATVGATREARVQFGVDGAERTARWGDTPGRCGRLITLVAPAVDVHGAEDTQAAVVGSLACALPASNRTKTTHGSTATVTVTRTKLVRDAVVCQLARTGCALAVWATSPAARPTTGGRVHLGVQ